MSEPFPRSIDFDSVADLYDVYVRADFDIPFWLEETRSVRGKLLELACGTGRVSIPLLEAGVDLTCVDYSPRMLEQFKRKLKEKGLSCPVYCQDMAELELPDRYELIFIPFHSFSEIIDRERQCLALRRIREHLAHGGRFILSLQNPSVRTATMDGALRPIGEFPMPDGGTLKVSARMTFNPSTHIAEGEQAYEVVSKEGVVVERRGLEIRFYLFERGEVEGLLIDSGYTPRIVYGDYHRRAFTIDTSPYILLIADNRIMA